MELVYSSCLPHSRVHAVAWSGMNLVALSVSVQSEGRITEACERADVHQLLVFDPNRPWDIHCVVSECKSVVKQLEWSVDGTRLLTLCQNNVVHVWRMKTQCITSWVAAHKQEAEQGDNVVHVSWLDCQPMATINHTKEDWNEAIEMQPISPHLRVMLGEAFITITTKGKVLIYSTSLPHCEANGGTFTADTTLPGRGAGCITIARTFVTQTGCILLGVGYQGGVVKVYSLTTRYHWTNQFSIIASLATELHRETGQISGLLMVAHADGCIVHCCYNDTQLYQWSVKDITRSGSYQSRREGVYTSPHQLACLAASGLCLGSHDPSMQEHKMSELLVFEDVDMKEGEGKWPVELLVTLGLGTQLTILARDTYKVLSSETLSEEGEEGGGMAAPVSKKPRLDTGDGGDGGNGGGACPLLCLSPNACCVLVVRGQCLQLYQIINPILGLKDSNVSEVSRVSRLLSLAVVSSLSPWDLALATARLQVQLGVDFVRQVLEHWCVDYELRAASLKQLLVTQFFTACSLLHMCVEEGLQPTLSYRNTARLYATAKLVELALCPSPPEQGMPRPSSPEQGEPRLQGMPRLQAVCTDNKTEENLNNLADDLDFKDFDLSTETAGHLQPHCHWVLELAILVVSAIAEGEVHVNALLGRSVSGVVMDTEDVATNRASDEHPSPSLLGLLRQLLLLVCVWNKSLPKPMVPVSTGALALLFKVVTLFHLSPHSPLSEDLQSEVRSNLPAYQHHHFLSLTKASHLQGFLAGLCTADLPEFFLQGSPSPLRPRVQSHYRCVDPYSPLALVVPRGMTPPWRDCFVEGQRDLLHGGTLSKAVVQSANLKQCSRCRSWTLTSEKLAVDQSNLSVSSGAVQQWRSAWAYACLCGGPWMLQTNRRT